MREVSSGKVTFIGAGPGDPRLLTLRAADRVREADVVLGAEATLGQVLEAARAGKRIARLVEDDVFDSDSAGREVAATAALGIAVEVVPGVSLGGAAAAFAGALGRARRVAVDKLDAALGALGEGQGVTLIAGLGLPSQRVFITTREGAPAFAPELAGATTTLVEGAPDPSLTWFSRRPLFGKRVLVTRAREQAGSMAALLREHGAEARVVPTIAIHPPADPEPLDRALEALRAGHYGWVVFTSANGVERVWAALRTRGGDARAFGAARLSAIGPATAATLTRVGLVADVVAKEYRGEVLADAIVEAIGADKGAVNAGGEPPRILLARAARARDVLPDTLRAAGCSVDVVAAYETRPASADVARGLAASLEAGDLDVLTFTSSSTVENFCDLLGGDAPALAARCRVASIGPVTTETASSYGIRVDVTAREYTVPGLVEALAGSYG